MKYFVTVGGRELEVVLEEGEGGLLARVAGRTHRVEYVEVDGLGQYGLAVDGRSFAVSIEGESGRLRVALGGEGFAVRVEEERERAARAAARPEERGPRVVRSRMPGIVLAVLVEPGESVERGRPLLLVEAMKMQNEIRSPIAGRVARLHARPGETVEAGAPLVTLEPASPA